jgi:hypothetical protein
VGTVRRECLDHIIVVKREPLVRLLREFAAYYNRVELDGKLRIAFGVTPLVQTMRCKGCCRTLGKTADDRPSGRGGTRYRTRQAVFTILQPSGIRIKCSRSTYGGRVTSRLRCRR